MTMVPSSNLGTSRVITYLYWTSSGFWRFISRNSSFSFYPHIHFCILFRIYNFIPGIKIYQLAIIRCPCIWPAAEMANPWRQRNELLFSYYIWSSKDLSLEKGDMDWWVSAGNWSGRSWHCWDSLPSNLITQRKQNGTRKSLNELYLPIF